VTTGPLDSGAPSLVIQTSYLGDTVLTTPLLRALAARGPVDVVTTAGAAPLLANHPAIRETIAYDKRGRDRGPVGLWRLARRLRSRRYSSAYLAQASIRSGALAWLAGVPRRVGFAGAAGRRFYTERLRVPRDGMHHAERLLRLGIGAAADVETCDIRPTLHPGEDEERAARALLAEAGLAGRPFVAVAPGSVWATKRWPYFPELVASLPSAVGVAVVGGAADRPLAAAIRAALPPATAMLDATGRLTLLASAALIGRAQVLVTNDSSPLHLASAMGTPTVALFGPTVPEFGFGPLAPQARVVGHATLPCRPCDRHGPKACPLGHWRCMRELTPEGVGAVVGPLLSDSAASLPEP